MKIIELQVENVKRVDAVWIEPGPNCNFIGGDNGEGKTSVIDAIVMGLAGEKAIPPDPIHHGKKRAKIKIDLGELVAERIITPKGTTLVLKAADGQPLATPQAILNKLATKLNFDPLAFVHMKSKEQLDALLEVVGLDFTELTKNRDKFFSERTDVNRHLKDTVAQKDAMEFHQGAPEDMVDVLELTKEHDHRKKMNEDKARAEQSVVSMEAAYAVACQKLDDLTEAVAVATKEAEDARSDVSMLKTAADLLPGADETTIVKQIADAGETNQHVAANRAYKATDEKANSLQGESEKLTEAIEEIDEEKARRIAEAELPIPGLSFDDEQVILDGVPFSQASSAQQLRASVAIVAAMGGDLKLALIRDGSRLDQKNLELLDEFCTEFGIQALIERVGHGRECQVIIEDGRARARTDDDDEKLAETVAQ